MPIIKNGKNISAIYKGNTPILKICKGLNVIWEAFKTLVLSGIPPLSFFSKGEPLIDYKVYGESEQGSIFNPSEATYIIGYFTRTVTTITTHANARTLYIPCLPNTTYKAIRDSEFSQFHFGYTEELPAVGVSVYNGVTASDKSVTELEITTGENARYLVVYCYNGYVTTDVWEDIINSIEVLQIPTPEAPIEIESVGDRTNNLLDEKLLGQVEGYNTYENGMWTTSALGSYGRDIFYNAVGTNHNVDINKVPKVTPSTTITIKFHDYINNGIDMTYTLYIGFYDSEGTYISRTTVNPAKVFTIEIPENAHYISFFRSSNYGTISFSHIHIVEGSYTETTMPDYEPYGYKIPVTIGGKNFLNIEHFSNIANWDAVPVYASYEFTLPNGNYHFNFETDLTTYSENILFLSKKKSTSSSPVVTLINGYNDIQAKTGNFTVENNEKLYFNWHCGSRNQTNLTKLINNVLNNFIIELGSKFTGYEPYIEPTTTNIYLSKPLYKIGDYADYIDLEKNKAIRPIYNEILTGNENWKQYLPTENKTTYYTTFDNMKAGYQNSLCTHFDSIENSWDIDRVGIYSIHNTRKNIYFNWLANSTVEEWKSYLATQYNNKPVVVCSVLDGAPIEEDIELPTIPTQAGTNVLSVNTKIKPSNVEITYKGK